MIVRHVCNSAHDQLLYQMESRAREKLLWHDMTPAAIPIDKILQHIAQYVELDHLFSEILRADIPINRTHASGPASSSSLDLDFAQQQPSGFQACQTEVAASSSASAAFMEQPQLLQAQECSSALSASVIHWLDGAGYMEHVAAAIKDAMERSQAKLMLKNYHELHDALLAGVLGALKPAEISVRIKAALLPRCIALASDFIDMPASNRKILQDDLTDQVKMLAANEVQQAIDRGLMFSLLPGGFVAEQPPAAQAARAPVQRHLQDIETVKDILSKAGMCLAGCQQTS